MATTEAPRWGGTTKERRHYIRQASGAKFFFDDPRFNLGDIAWHLAGINRYTGGSRYSVAQHCVVAAQMAQRFYTDHVLLPARMTIHDAAESVLGDVSSPLKALLPDYREIESRIDEEVERFFGVTFLGNEQVHEVDTRMWLTERLLMYPGSPQTDDYAGPLEPFPLTKEELEESFGSWGADRAEYEWLHTARQHLPWVFA
jgi:hypothetical protein